MKLLSWHCFSLILFILIFHQGIRLISDIIVTSTFLLILSALILVSLSIHLSSSPAISDLTSPLTCGEPGSWSSCWCSSWLYSTGVAGSWTGETACCPPRVPAAGPGSGRGAAACRSSSCRTASGREAGTGLAWRGCGVGAVSHSEAACPLSPACSRLPKAGGVARNGRRVERCWSDVC